MNIVKPPEVGGARGLILNSPDLARLRFHYWLRNQGKATLQAAGNFTIEYLLCLEYKVPNIYIT